MINVKQIIIIILFCSVLFAQNYSGYAGNYFHNGADARSIAMGTRLQRGPI